MFTSRPYSQVAQHTDSDSDGEVSIFAREGELMGGGLRIRGPASNSRQSRFWCFAMVCLAAVVLCVLVAMVVVIVMMYHYGSLQLGHHTGGEPVPSLPVTGPAATPVLEGGVGDVQVTPVTPVTPGLDEGVDTVISSKEPSYSVPQSPIATSSTSAAGTDTTEIPPHSENETATLATESQNVSQKVSDTTPLPPKEPLTPPEPTENPSLSPRENLAWERVINPAASESSVQLHDMNGDGTLDVVVVNAGSPCIVKVIALDGRNGETIWESLVFFSVIAIRCELDVNSDGVIDCLVAGRFGGFMALSGVDGKVIWSVDPSIAFPRYNFFFPLVVGDMDGDGTPDLLNVHGGDTTYKSDQKDRSPGYLVAVSGRTGQRLLQETVLIPDGRESYMSPELYSFADGTEVVLIGSGGETIPGSLWAVTLSSIQDKILEYTKTSSDYASYEIVTDYVNHLCMKDMSSEEIEAVRPVFDGAYNLERSTADTSPFSSCPQWGNPQPIWNKYNLCMYEVVRTKSKGVIQPPVIVDMTGDGHDDLVVSLFDGHTVVLDGRGGALVWDTFVPGSESYSLPAPLFYNEDDTPDLLVRINIGMWQDYNSSYMAVLDGKDGNTLWTLNSTYAGMMSGLSVVSDTRGQDAALFLVSGRQDEPDPNVGGRGDTQIDSRFQFQSNDQFDSRFQYQNDYQTDPNFRRPGYLENPGTGHQQADPSYRRPDYLENPGMGHQQADPSYRRPGYLENPGMGHQQADPSYRRPGYEDNAQTDLRYQYQQAGPGSRWSDYHRQPQSDTRFQSNPPSTEWPDHTVSLGREGDRPRPWQEQSRKEPRSLGLHFPLPREHPQCTHMYFEGPGSPVCHWYEWFSDGQEAYIREKRHGGMSDGVGSFDTGAEPPIVWSQFPGSEYPDPDTDLDAFLRYCGRSLKQLTAYLFLVTRGLAEGGDIRPLAQHEPFVYRTRKRRDSHTVHPEEDPNFKMEDVPTLKDFRCAHIAAPVVIPTTPAIGDLNGDGRLEVVYVVLWSRLHELPYNLIAPKMFVGVFTLEDRFTEVYGEEKVEFSRFLPSDQQPWSRYMGVSGDGVFRLQKTGDY